MPGVCNVIGARLRCEEQITVSMVSHSTFDISPAARPLFNPTYYSAPISSIIPFLLHIPLS